MGVLRVDVTGARRKLAQLVAGLRAAASGKVVDVAAARVQEQIDGASQAIIGRHTETGKAAGDRVVERAAGLVTLSWPRYLAYHRWNPFRSGMPPFAVKAASKIFAAVLVEALGGRGKPGGELADEILAAAEASDAKKAATAKRSENRRELAKIAPWLKGKKR